MAKKTLSPKQKGYIEEYIKDPLHPLKAVRNTYDCTNDSSRVLQHRLKYNPEVQDAITKKLEELSKVNDITPEQIRAGIIEVAVKGKHADKLRAYELLAKIKKLFKDNSETLVNLYNVDANK